MLPKLRRFLGSKPYRSSKRSASGHGKELQNDINSPEESFLEESFRSRTSSIDENTLNQELHFIVDYLGYCQVSEVQSISLLLESVKRVKKGYTEPRRVDFVITEGVLKISRVGGHALILTVPLYIVALCAQESLRGFDKCFGINITRKNAHLCYVFQAGSSLEASSIVRSVALSFKSLGKMLRQKKERIRIKQRRRKTTSFRHMYADSDWSSQTGYVNDSINDSWQTFDMRSRVSSTTSKGTCSEIRSAIVHKNSLNQLSSKRPLKNHLLKHVEFTSLSPVPSNSSSNGNSARIMDNLRQSSIVKQPFLIPNVPDDEGNLKTEADGHEDIFPLPYHEKNPNKNGCSRLQPGSSSRLLSCDEDSSYTHDEDQGNGMSDKDDDSDEILELVLSAIQRGDLTCLSSYLDDGVDVDLSDSTRRSLLFHAVNYSKISVVQLLLDRTKRYDTLHQAASNRDKSIAQVLLSNGANVRAKDCEFRTPLHMCAGHPSGTEMSCLLIEHGARISDNNIDGSRPLDLLPDLKELQSRLVQSVCEVFMAADISKSHSDSIMSLPSVYSVHSACWVTHYGQSQGNVVTNSQPLAHARDVSRRFMANFDVGSFQWKKDAKIINSDGSEQHQQPTVIHEEKILSTCNIHVDKTNAFAKNDFPATTQGQNINTSCSSSNPSMMAERIDEESSCHENIRVSTKSSRRGTMIVGSVDTWTRGILSEAVMSSTPADFVLGEKASFKCDTPVPLTNPEKCADSRFMTYHDPNSTRQGILHNSKLHNDSDDSLRRRTRRDSVRFQSIITLEKGTGDGVVDPESLSLTQDVGKDLTDRTDSFRARQRSNTDSGYSGTSLTRSYKEEDPVFVALNSLVKLSFNPECQPLLLSYLCLPKASSLLSLFAKSPTSRPWVAEAVCILIKNLASIEGPDSRRRASDAGLVRTVLQLAETQDPVQRTCLEVLDNLLKDVNCEREYNSTMTNIPSEPVLNLLCCYNDGERTIHSRCAEIADLNVGMTRRIFRSFQDPHHKLNPRLVATRLLVASSTHLKVQRELGAQRAIGLLLEALRDDDHEIVHNAAVTLANIAMHDGNHEVLDNSGVVESLTKFVEKDSKTYYHVTRALVYLNCDDDDCGYLFDQDTDKPRLLYTDCSSNQEPYVKGGNLEELVRVLTTNAITLWGGVPLLGPSPTSRSLIKGAKTRASEEQVIEFILATYATYTNAVVLMRLLIHRFHDPSLIHLFDDETGVLKDQSSCLPLVHVSLMRIWVTWLEKFPHDFRENHVLQVEMCRLVRNLAIHQGPYLVCAHHLRDLLTCYRENSTISYPPDNHCHHDLLFRTCQQAVVSGKLPVRIDDAVYLAALQLYIEQSSSGDQPNSKVFVTDYSMEKIPTSRIKLCLNPFFHRVKNVYKKVRTYNEQITRDAPSQRKAKHDFIDCCQGMAAYGCTFFRVKEISSSNKSSMRKRLLGVGDKETVLLENKSRNVLKKWDLTSLLGWKAEENNISLLLLFSECSLHFQCESYEDRELLQNTIKKCVFKRHCEGINRKDYLPWTKRSEDRQNWGDAAMEQEINCRLEVLTKTTNIFQSRDEWQSYSLMYTIRGNEESKRRRHSSPVHKNSKQRNDHLTSMPFFNNKMAVDENVGDDVCVPLMAYSVGTLDQKIAEPSHLSSITSSSQYKLSSSPTRSTLNQPSLANMITNYEDCSRAQGQKPNTEDLMSSLNLLFVCVHQTLNWQTLTVLISRSLGYLFECLANQRQILFCMFTHSLLKLLRFPRELARQITLIDHGLFRNITTADILKRVTDGSNKRQKKDENYHGRTTVELFSDRFNQLSSWVVASLLKEECDENVAEMLAQFIETAKQCLELRNYNAVMAIAVGALCSSPVRRLRKAIPGLIPKAYLDQLHIMEVLMDSRENHKKYRESLRVCPSPAVPYFGVYLKDLIYISEGNPDYLNGGMINLSKRRLMYSVLHETRRFQVKSYNFEQVPEIREYLFNTRFYTDDELHQMSRKIDTSSRRTISECSREVSMSVSGASIT